MNFKAVSKSAHEVSLHWDTPETQQRGPPLVNYELLVTPLDGEGNTDCTSRQIFIEPSLNSYLVNALLPNTKYEFRLAAVSETGAGIQSEATAKTKEYGSRQSSFYFKAVEISNISQRFINFSVKTIYVVGKTSIGVYALSRLYKSIKILKTKLSWIQ